MVISYNERKHSDSHISIIWMMKYTQTDFFIIWRCTQIKFENLPFLNDHDAAHL